MPFWNEINSEKDSTRGFRQEEQKIELERVKQEIVKIISQKENFNKENEVLKIYQLAFSQLNEQNTTLKERIQTLEASNHTDQNEASSIPEILIENAVNSIIDIDRSSPDGQEIDNEYLSLPSQSIDLKNSEIIHLEEKIKILETEKSSLETERKELLEKHQQLEESLELMSSEFESMEDYWQKKIDEERKFYEEQLKSNEIQFKDLEFKMKEYEDLLMAVEPKPNDEPDRLSTIDETRSMEEEVNVWEEEISHLKMQIEKLEENHKAEVKMLKLTSTKPTEEEEPAEPISLGDKRKVLESSWLKIVESESTRQSTLERNARQEARRLQELKNYIQEECDQLLLRRDKLQQEVGCHSDYRWEYGQSSSSMDTFVLPNRNLAECQPFASQEMCCLRKSSSSVSRGKNHHFPADDLSSVAQAYKVVLQDITREILLAEADLTNPTTSTHKLILRSLNQRLEHQVSRCQHLQSSLALVRAQSSHAIEATRDQHVSEISQLESLVFSSQELVRKQTRKHMEQMDKLSSSDSLLDKLCHDNLNIMEQLKEIKKKM